MAPSAFLSDGSVTEYEILNGCAGVLTCVLFLQRFYFGSATWRA